MLSYFGEWNRIASIDLDLKAAWHDLPFMEHLHSGKTLAAGMEMVASQSMTSADPKAVQAAMEVWVSLHIVVKKNATALVLLILDQFAEIDCNFKHLSVATSKIN